MKYTTNYNLKKPEGTDTVNINDLNNNTDILDTNINSLREQINNFATNKADLVNGKVPSNQLPNIEVPVQSVNGKTGAVILAKSDIGLGSVDNTSDNTKAVLSATKFATARAINGVNFDGTANITIADNTKAPANHASTGVTYGLGTIANYGHVATKNDLNASSYQDGQALSAYQGYLLNNAINNIKEPLSGKTTITDSIGADAIFLKTIPIGMGKKIGRLMFTKIGGIPVWTSLILFSTNKLYAMSAGRDGNNDGYASGLGLPLTEKDTLSNSRKIEINDAYIEGTNLVLQFKNISAITQELAADAYWEVM